MTEYLIWFNLIKFYYYLLLLQVRAAELMVKKYGATIEAVFIRRAQPVDKTPGFDEEVGREKHLAQWRAQRIFFFDTYVGAAVQVNISYIFSFFYWTLWLNSQEI